MDELIRVGDIITDCVTAFFYRLEPTLEPHKRLFACMIVRALRDWFECRKELFKEEEEQDRRRLGLATSAFDWLMSDEDFIGVKVLNGKRVGIVTFHTACTGLGLDPKVIRRLVYTKRRSQLEALHGDFFNQYSRNRNTKAAALWDTDCPEKDRCV